MSRFWRPVETTQDLDMQQQDKQHPVTEFIDNNGVELLVSSVTQATTEQLIVNGFPLADNTVERGKWNCSWTISIVICKINWSSYLHLSRTRRTAEIPS